jgi:hypothetical protein
MKTKKLILVIALISLSMLTKVAAQDGASYNTAIGLRLGETSGLTVKLKGSDHAIEGILGIWSDAFSITGLYEKHINAGGIPGLEWYYGGGAHVAFLTSGPYYNGVYYYSVDRGRYYFYRYGGDLGIGIDGIIGIEYKIPAIPIAFSLDLKPFLEYNTGGFFYGSFDPGLGIKVAF